MFKSYKGEMNRRSLNIGLATTALSAVIGPRAAVAAKETLVAALGTIGSQLHPIMGATTTEKDINKLLFDSLLRLGPNGEIENIASERFERLPNSKWRFYLRKNIRFHNGQPLTAKDVKFSLEAYLKPGSRRRWELASCLERVEIVDDYTIDVVTKGPSRIILSRLGSASFIVPEGMIPSQEFDRNPVGSGPFKFVEFTPNDRLVLERNVDYWSLKAPAAKVIFRQIPEDATRMTALIAREVDFAASVPLDDVPRLKKAGLKVYAGDTVRSLYFAINFLKDGPFRNQRVRQAANLAIDRHAINQAFLGGLGVIAKGPTATVGLKFAKEMRPPYELNLRKAKELLSQAGFPNGFKGKLCTTAGRYVKDKEIAEAVAGQLSQIGIMLDVVPLEWAAFVQQTKTNLETTGLQYDLFMSGWTAATYDLDYGLEPFSPTNQAFNSGRYINDELTKLMNDVVTEFDEDKAQAMYSRIQEIIWNDAPMIFLFSLPSVHASVAALAGLAVNRNDSIDWIGAHLT